MNSRQPGPRDGHFEAADGPHDVGPTGAGSPSWAQGAEATGKAAGAELGRRDLLLDINVLHQDFPRTLSDLEESVRQIDSHLTTVESTSANQVMEKVDLTARIEKFEANYNLLQDKLDDLENQSGCNNIRIREIGVAVPASDLEAYFQAVFAHLLGPGCDQPVLLDRTHRVLSLYQQQKYLPPDVLTRVHYFHIKEKEEWLGDQTQWSSGAITSPYTRMCLFTP
ncbi:hypothetical protein NDU88_004709 [Pleurodeles waltl]|uniref:Uncharacterized protein n=1 Tax=Pleurodeles waltl TaxID=8319 RepID=A0AAV7VKP8_PLEWA|nr:hypothetical protein NDU88_004709 [Pleurodeles waltl]